MEEMNKKYILTEDTQCVEGHILHRIQAIKNFGDVKAGDLGGWVESTKNLSQSGDCWVYDDSCVYQRALVIGDAVVRGNSFIFGNAEVNKMAVIIHGSIYGYTCITDFARVESVIPYRAVVRGNAKLYSTTIFSLLSPCKPFVIENDCLGSNAYITSPLDYLTIGPIGSRSDRTTFYKTNGHGIWVSCGCFNGSIDLFSLQVQETHRGNPKHLRDYLSAMEFAKRVLR